MATEKLISHCPRTLSKMWLFCVLLVSPLFFGGCVMHYKEEYLVRAFPAPPPSLEELKNEFPVFDVSEERISVANDERLYSLRLLRPDAKATVLYFGGNGYRIGMNARYSAETYAKLPVNLVLVDHRGYGASTGVPGIEALMSDALSVYDSLRTEDSLAALPIIVHGQSLGSFMAGHVASNRTLDGLVLESSVTTTEDWVRYIRGQRPIWQRMLVRRVDVDASLAGRGNLSVVRELDEPELFVVGEQDPATPVSFSQELFSTASTKNKKLLVVPGASHNNATRSDAFREAMLEFVLRVTNSGET